MPVPKHFTVKSLAQHLGVSRSYVKNLIQNREIGFRRTGDAKNAKFIIPETEVEKWLDRRPMLPSVHEVMGQR